MDSSGKKMAVLKLPFLTKTKVINTERLLSNKCLMYTGDNTITWNTKGGHLS